VSRLDDAEAQCSADDLKKTRKRLQQVATALGQYAHRLAGLAARKKLGDAVRKQYLQAGQALAPDLRTLRAKVQCPPA